MNSHHSHLVTTEAGIRGNASSKVDETLVGQGP
jgi:hypothetical protein